MVSSNDDNGRLSILSLFCIFCPHYVLIFVSSSFISLGLLPPNYVIIQAQYLYV